MPTKRALPVQKGPGGFIVHEASGFRSRDTVTLAASQDVSSGEIVAKTGSGANVQYVAVVPTATDGTQTPAGIAIYPAATAAGVTAKISIINTDCEVNASELVYNTTDDARISALREGLKSLGIKCRMTIQEATK